MLLNFIFLSILWFKLRMRKKCLEISFFFLTFCYKLRKNASKFLFFFSFFFLHKNGRNEISKHFFKFFSPNQRMKNWNFLCFFSYFSTNSPQNEKNSQFLDRTFPNPALRSNPRSWSTERKKKLINGLLHTHILSPNISQRPPSLERHASRQLHRYIATSLRLSQCVRQFHHLLSIYCVISLRRCAAAAATQAQTR